MRTSQIPDDHQSDHVDMIHGGGEASPIPINKDSKTKNGCFVTMHYEDNRNIRTLERTARLLENMGH